MQSRVKTSTKTKTKTKVTTVETRATDETHGSRGRRFSKGDRVTHRLFTGFVMTVKEVRPCKPIDHDQCRIEDPTGHVDWVCGMDLVAAP